MSDEGGSRKRVWNGDSYTPEDVSTALAFEPLELPGLPRRAALRDCVVVALCFATAWVGARVWYYTHARGVTANDILGVWLLPKLVFTVAACVLSIFVAMAEKWSPQGLALRKEALGRQLLWGAGGGVFVYAALLAWLGAEWCIRYALWRLGVHGASAAEAVSNSGGPSGEPAVGGALMILVAAAVAEEFAFRGLLLPRLRRVTGRWWAAAVICALFCGLFDAPSGLCYVGSTAAVSLALCAVFIASRSLIAAAMAHALYDIALYWLGSWWSAGG